MDLATQFQSGMALLGRLHSLMANLTVDYPPPIANHLPQELALEATLDAVNHIYSWHPTPQENRLAETAESLARMIPVVDLPGQLVHGDFWDNNVLFRGNNVAAVLDFDFADIRPRIDDLALPLSYAIQNQVGLTEIRDLVDAYDSGLSVPLSTAERRALPYSMARMALSFLQYLLLPLDLADAQRLRQEFNEKRGPTCEWWLNQLQAGTLSDDSFL